LTLSATTVNHRYFFGNNTNTSATNANIGSHASYAIANASIPHTPLPDPIPLSGITQAQYNTNTWGWLAAARNNVIGYWDVQFGWKHYYGIYEVPADQVRTEFAFQSRRQDGQNGNFLDGVSFKVPSFLSISKNILDQTGSGAHFVKPGDNLTVELNVTAQGEIPAANIVIKDQLDPFNVYIGYRPGSVTASVRRWNNQTTPPTLGPPTAVTIPAANIIAPTAANNHTVEIRLPTTFVLNGGDVLTVRFGVNVLHRVGGNPLGTETLLYFFRNQAVVEYREAASANLPQFTRAPLTLTAPPAVDGVIKTNASNIVLVNIDPVRLEKTVATKGFAGPGPDPLIDDEPFTVHLTAQNTLDFAQINTFRTSGLITDVIPSGFEITPSVINGNTAPIWRRVSTRTGDGNADWTVGQWESVTFSTTDNIDGSTRITISNVALNNTAHRIEFRYDVEYTGEAYGVSFIHVNANYRYQYFDDDPTMSGLMVLLNFPQPVVGIRIRTEPDEFNVNTTPAVPDVLDITENDNFTERLTDDEYIVQPEVVLLVPDGNGGFADAPINPITEYYWIDNDYFTAVLIPGTNNLEFTHKSGDGPFVLHYQIRLVATRAGGTPASFNLSSGVETVTITVGGNGGG